MKDEIRKFLQEMSIEFEENVSLKRKTWIKRGGIASFYVLPKSSDELLVICRFLFRNNIPFDIVGHTSNMYFLNEYDSNVFISTKNLLGEIETDDSFVCEAGVNVSGFSRRMSEMGYVGFEGLVGLPGTMGGAVVNNSSAFGFSILNMSIDVECLNERGTVEWLTPNKLVLGHRNTIVKDGQRRLVVLKIRLKKEIGNAKNLCERLVFYEKKRSLLQEEKRMNLGSCYKKCGSSLGLKCLLFVRFFLRHFFSLFPQSVKDKQIDRYVFYKLAGYPVLVKYVDRKQPNCFLWKDENADEVFFNQYQPFMKKYYKASDLEIEIKIKSKEVVR